MRPIILSKDEVSARPFVEKTKSVGSMQQQQSRQKGRSSSSITTANHESVNHNQSTKKYDRVVLEVGGRSFVTSQSTLLKHSTYFALNYQHWSTTPVSSNRRQKRRASGVEEGDKENNHKDNNCQGDEIIYLDQDPEYFEVLLRYMRSGIIHARALDNPHVIILAEYLGIDSLLKEVKVRAYRNMNPRFVGNPDEAEREFDTKYAGGGSSIHPAIIRGFLPRYIADYATEKEFATIQCSLAEGIDDPDTCRVVDSSTSNRNAVQMPLLGALNWLHYYGFTKLEKDMNFPICGDDDVKTFSRRIGGDSSGSESACLNSILIDSINHGKNPRKVFAMILSNRFDNDIILYPPGAGEEIPEGNVGENYPNSEWCTRLDDESVEWLFENGFSQREKTLEQTFQMHMTTVLHNQYFPPKEGRTELVNATSAGAGDDNTTVADDGFFFQVYSQNLRESVA